MPLIIQVQFLILQCLFILGLGVPNPMPPVPPKEPYKPPQANIDRACEMKAEIMRKVEELGKILPANTLDQLIDELGGPENVSEMTGRKGRVVQVRKCNLFSCTALVVLFLGKKEN